MRFPRRIFRPERKNKHEAEGNLSNETSRNLKFPQLLHRRTFKSPEMDRACSKRRSERGHTELWLKNLKGRPHLGNLRIAWRILLKWILNKDNMGDSEQGAVFGFCQKKKSNEIACSTKGGGTSWSAERLSAYEGHHSMVLVHSLKWSFSELWIILRLLLIIVTMNECMMGHKVAGDCQIALPTQGTVLAPSPRTRLFSLHYDLLGVNWSGKKNTATTMADH